MIDIPFYSVNETSPGVSASGLATNSVTDNPRLLLNNIHDVRPVLGETTAIDVTFSFVTYSTIAFTDQSIYCFGQQPWSVRFAGTVTPPDEKGNYGFNPTPGKNADNGSGAFGAGVRNDAESNCHRRRHG